MARIEVAITRQGRAWITATAPVEPPRVNWLHSVGGGTDVPRHDRAAHAAGRPHDCSTVRSATQFTGTVEDVEAAVQALAEQYRSHDLRILLFTAGGGRQEVRP